MSSAPTPLRDRAAHLGEILLRALQGQHPDWTPDLIALYARRAFSLAAQSLQEEAKHLSGGGGATGPA